MLHLIIELGNGIVAGFRIKHLMIGNVCVKIALNMAEILRGQVWVHARIPVVGHEQAQQFLPIP